MAVHNRCVRDGLFTRLTMLFTADARLIFTGLPIEPVQGRDAIAKAFAEHPPNDELVLVETWMDNGAHHGRYHWKRRPDNPGGSLHVIPEGGLIKSLTVNVLLQSALIPVL